MTALQVLEKTLKLEQHARSRDMAQHIYAKAEELLGAGENPDVLRGALELLFKRHREGGQVIERDAVAEVLDSFDELVSSDHALPA